MLTAEECQWLYQKLGEYQERPSAPMPPKEEAPSMGAYGHLARLLARDLLAAHVEPAEMDAERIRRQNDFYEKWSAKLIPSRSDIKKSQDRTDDGRALVDLCDRLRVIARERREKAQ